MRIALLANPDVRIPVVGYGGLERQVQWLAEELCRQGHEVTIFGNVETAGPGIAWEKAEAGENNLFGLKIGAEISHPWSGVRIRHQMDVLDHLSALKKFDVVHDRTKDHPMRLTKGIPWVATLVWSDQFVLPGHAVYVSEAVREVYKDPSAPVIPECVPSPDLPEVPTGDDFLSFGRMDPIKGTHAAVEVCHHAKVGLTVAGHVGRWGDAGYALAVRKRCHEFGFRFVPNPDNAEARRLVGSARGLVHLHTWTESFSEVVAEALCQGVPVLTTDAGAPKEWVTATGGGIVVSAEGIKKGQIPDAAVESFFHDPGKWAGMRAAVREKAREMFDPARIARLYVEEYRRAAS